MDMPIKRMGAREFRDLGLLQEVNRLFLHPRGLALEVETDDDRCGHVFGDRQTCLSPRSSMRHDVDSKNGEIRLAAHEFVPLERYSSVWDSRDDPEGIMYDLSEPLDTAKAARVALMLDDKARARLEGLGWVYQPLFPSDPAHEFVPPVETNLGVTVTASAKVIKRSDPLLQVLRGLPPGTTVPRHISGFGTLHIRLSSAGVLEAQGYDRAWFAVREVPVAGSEFPALERVPS